MNRSAVGETLQLAMNDNEKRRERKIKLKREEKKRKSKAAKTQRFQLKFRSIPYQLNSTKPIRNLKLNDRELS